MLTGLKEKKKDLTDKLKLHIRKKSILKFKYEKS